MRNEELNGPPWDLDLKLSKLVLRTVLPRGKGGIHLCGEPLQVRLDYFLQAWYSGRPFLSRKSRGKTSNKSEAAAVEKGSRI